MAESASRQGLGEKGRSKYVLKKSGQTKICTMEVAPMKEFTIEMSLKPFKEKGDRYIGRVLERMFRQWSMVTDRFDSVSVLLWTGDGSELLDFTGDLSRTFEWGKWVGRANEFDGDWDRKIDPLKLSPHAKRYPYTSDPVDFSYADLRDLVSEIKKVGATVTGKPIRVGTTFDPGPEFSISDFKYERHPEICTAGSMGEGSFAVSFEKLHADDYPYYSYPDGVPEGLSLASLLGAQANAFLESMGMDYLWLSNGFGFGVENWSTLGVLFDGERFVEDRDVISETGRKALSFWHDFREKCPRFDIQTRGTNLTVGIDFSTDGCSLKKIYCGGFNMTPPPNSPWAALDKNFGLEIAGYLSRIAELPEDKDYMYRFYLHDPWWMNSPWFDRYEGEPHDIYLPLSLCRIDSEGRVERPELFNVMTADTSLGELPNEAVATVTPHLLKAMDEAPDQIPPFVWVYPFDEYQSEDPSTGAYQLGKAFFEDWFMVRAINEGLPVPGVISSDGFANLIEQADHQIEGSIAYVPVPRAGSRLEKALLAFLNRRGRAIVYGSLTEASNELKERLGVELADPIQGEMMFSRSNGDTAANDSLFHDPSLSNGGIDTVLSDDPGVQDLAWVERDGVRRVYATQRLDRGGQVIWIRGTNDHRVGRGGNLLRPIERAEHFVSSTMMRYSLSRLGFNISFSREDPDSLSPVISISRHANGFFFSGYHRDATVGVRMRFPLGVPILIGHEVYIRKGVGEYHFPRSWHRECRVFVGQEQDGVISMSEYGPVSMIMRRRVLLEGLIDATIFVFPENGRVEKCELLLNSTKPNSTGEPFRYEAIETAWGKALVAEHVTGHVMVSTEFDHVRYLEEGEGSVR
ncbi:MAG: hypothetical protein SOU51_05085 [Collinsella sp.]|nr:hypothetical protein [Collinsella sp.]